MARPGTPARDRRLVALRWTLNILAAAAVAAGLYFYYL